MCVLSSPSSSFSVWIVRMDKNSGGGIIVVERDAESRGPARCEKSAKARNSHRKIIVKQNNNSFNRFATMLPAAFCIILVSYFFVFGICRLGHRQQQCFRAIIGRLRASEAFTENNRRCEFCFWSFPCKSVILANDNGIS